MGRGADRIMRKYTLLAGVLSFLLLLAACSKDDESVTLQFGHALPPDTNQAIEINKMAEAVEEETEGRVKFEIYPNSQLGRDRKSTRLNSSHVSISYAVFCLKKKRIVDQAREGSTPSGR